VFVFHKKAVPTCCSREVPVAAVQARRACAHRIGVNFVDTYPALGLLPIRCRGGGQRAQAGRAVAEVTDVKKGDRVAYTGLPLLWSARRAGRSSGEDPGRHYRRAGASMMLRDDGHYLIHRHTGEARETVLWHAAAAFGIIACQWLKKLGVTVIGHRGFRGEGDARQGPSAEHVVNYSKENFSSAYARSPAARSCRVYDALARRPGTARSTACGRRILMCLSATPRGPVPR